MKGYRTFTLSALVLLLGTAETFQWTDIVNESTSGAIVMVIGTLIAILRSVTNTTAGEVK